MASISQKIKLLAGILHGEHAFNSPFFVDVELTNKCNLHCAGCQYFSPYVNRNDIQTPDIKEIPYDLFRKMCNELSGMKTRSLILQGAGEPLLHTRFREIVLSAKDTGFHIELITNGTLLNNAMIDFLIDSKIQRIKISLFASDPVQYEKYYPGTKPELFQKILSAMKQFKLRKAELNTRFPKLYIGYGIHRYNYQSLESIIDLAYNHGCDGLYFSPLYTVRGSLSSWSLSSEELLTVTGELPRLKEKLKGHRMDHNLTQYLQRLEYGEDGWKHAPCYAAWYHLRVCVDGNVQPCGRCNLSFGNLLEQPISELWNGEKIRTFRRTTVTRGGVAALGDTCDCGVCCYWPQSKQIHSYMKWIRS